MRRQISTRKFKFEGAVEIVTVRAPSLAALLPFLLVPQQNSLAILALLIGSDLQELYLSFHKIIEKSALPIPTMLSASGEPGPSIL